MKYKQIICLVMLSILLVSCIPTRDIEKLGVINTGGVDKLDNNLIEVTSEIFHFASQSNDLTRIVSGKGKTIKDSVDNASAKSNFTLTAEKIQLEIYGKETAKKGILPYIDTLDRDASLPDSMYLAISDTSAKELLSTDSKDISLDIGQFLHGLIEENSTDHLFPRINFQDFQSSFYDIGKDPYLPLFELEDGIPILAALAIMQDDQYVGRIPIKDKIYFNLMQENIKDMTMEVGLPTKPFEKYIEKEENISKREETLHTSYNILKGSSKTKLIDQENLVFETNIKLRLNLLEMTEEVLVKNEAVTKLLEKEVNKAVQSHYEELLAQLQEWNADPFGYGAVYRIHRGKGHQLTRNEWRERFPEITVNFNVDANIVSHGAVD